MTCDAHFGTQPSSSSQKSCVKIWFGLVEPFKSYHGNIPKKKKKSEEIENNIHPFRPYNNNNNNNNKMMKPLAFYPPREWVAPGGGWGGGLKFWESTLFSG